MQLVPFERFSRFQTIDDFRCGPHTGARQTLWSFCSSGELPNSIQMLL
jgi:hypothetical protein